MIRSDLLKIFVKLKILTLNNYPQGFILAIIDRWKNKGFYPNEVIINKKDIYEKTILPLYKIYQQKLTDLNSCDFGDLFCILLKF